MKLAVLIAGWIGALALTTMPSSASVEDPYEEPIQYALEYLTSGNAAATVVTGTEVIVKPLRTWKSVSGHYCRRYEIRITEPGVAPIRDERTRCREKTGGWRPVASD